MKQLQSRQVLKMTYFSMNSFRFSNNIISICNKTEKFQGMVKYIYEVVMLKGTSEILQLANKEKKEQISQIFNNEVTASKSLNINLFHEILNYLMKTDPKLIYENDDHFLALINILLLIPITFRKDTDLHKKMYSLMHRLIMDVAKNTDKYSMKVIKGLLSLKVFKKMVEKISFDVTISSGTNFTNEQKQIFEIFFTLWKLDDKIEEFTSIYKYGDKVLEINKSLTILREMKNFDLVSYLVYYEKELSEEQRNIKLNEETFHNLFEGKTSAKFEYEGFKKMSITVNNESKIDKMKSMVFSTDPEGKEVIKKITQKNIDENNTQFSMNTSKFYVHYPYNHPRVTCFGYGSNYRLGNNDSYTTSGPIEMIDWSKGVRQIVARNTYTVILGEDGELYYAGYKNSFGNYHYYMQKYEKKMPPGAIKEIKAGTNNFACLTEDDELWIEGYDTGYNIDNNSEKYDLYRKERPDEENEKIIDWDVGYNCHCIITSSGKCYAAGNDYTRGIELECTSKEYKEIKFDEGVKPLKCRMTNSYDTYRVGLFFVDNKGKTELWTAGYNSSGLLGQGDGVSDVKKLKKMDYDSEKLNFVEARIDYNFGYAVTDKGELYGWGYNGYRQLGMADTKNYGTMTEIPFFKEYYVHEFYQGQNHAMVIASKRGETNKKMVFAVGDCQGVGTEGKNDDGVMHLKDYDNTEFKLIACGESCTFMVPASGEKYAGENVSVHKGYTCAETGETPIVGTMHFYRDADKNWVFLSEEGYKKVKDTLPAITYATKYPTSEKIETGEWPEIDEKDLLEDEKNDEGPKYISSNSIAGEQINPIHRTDEDWVFNRKSFDMKQLIFTRITRPLKEGKELPLIQLEKFYKLTDFHGIKVEIAPDYSFEKNDTIINIEKAKYDNVVNKIKKFDTKLDDYLQESMENYISKNNTDFFYNTNVEIPASNLEFKNKELKKMSETNIQPRINAFLTFNKYFLVTIPFVILDEEVIKEVTQGKGNIEDATLSTLFMVGKSLAFRAIKSSYIKKIADSLPTNYEEPEVNLNRNLIMHKKDKGKVDHKGEWTTFGQIMQKVKSNGYQYLRVPNSSTKAWRSNFLGEGSIDAGGPFRESIVNLTDELYHRCLPLLIPTQNNKNDHGLGRDCYTINPNSTTPTHLEMYKFLGALIGMAFRSGTIIDIKFPGLLWKKFIGEPLTIDDLNSSDAYAVQAIKDLEKSKDQYPKEMFEEAMELNWTTQLSNGETVPVCEDGENRIVGFDDVEEYNKLVLQTRFDEGTKQMESMREGFDVIFPTSILGILNWRDVEERVRGPAEISVEALKSITEHSSCTAEDDFVKRFWRVFEEFTQEQRSMFLKFVWGRSRLPPAERLKDQNFKLYLMDSYKFTDHDVHFPEAHTCFFQLDLPRYTNDKSCREKILYAIEACGEIDTDNSSYSIAAAEGDYDSD